MSRIAKEFLTRCFAPGETIALLLRNENPVRTRQRIMALERVLGSRYLAWLSHENHLGANVYVAANPLRPRSRKRTKESIATVRHLYLDIDTDGDYRLATLRASEHVPIPSAILSTSPGKYQIFWRVDDLDFEHQEQALKLSEAQTAAGVPGRLELILGGGHGNWGQPELERTFNESVAFLNQHLKKSSQ